MAILSYKYRIYPNQTQQRQLDRVFDVACHVYNDVANMARLDYQSDVKWSWMRVGKAWGDIRRDQPVISAVLPFDTVSELVRRYDFSLKSFWALRKNGHEDAMPPGDIARGRFRSVGYRYGSGIKLIEDYDGVARLRVFAVDGLIRVHYHRPIPEGWQIKNVVISNKKNGDWYIVCQIENKAFEPSLTHGDAIGIDVGMYSLLALSDGTMVDNPRWYRQGQKRRRVLQRQLARRQVSGSDGKPLSAPHQSQNWRDTRKQIARHEAKIARQREYYWHTVTDWLTKNYSFIAIENLTLDFMIKNKHLAMSAHDASFGMFWQFLEYKCAMRGVELVRVNPAYTSQICSGCGEIVKKGLEVRTHRCVSCGLEIDRDVNAAINILNLAFYGEVQPPHVVTQANGSNVA